MKTIYSKTGQPIFAIDTEDEKYLTPLIDSIKQNLVVTSQNATGNCMYYLIGKYGFTAIEALRIIVALAGEG